MKWGSRTAVVTAVACLAAGLAAVAIGATRAFTTKLIRGKAPL
jgi:hypothetical protein